MADTKDQLYDKVLTAKADPGPARRARAPPFEKKMVLFLVNFHCI